MFYIIFALSFGLAMLAFFQIARTLQMRPNGYVWIILLWVALVLAGIVGVYYYLPDSLLACFMGYGLGLLSVMRPGRD